MTVGAAPRLLDADQQRVVTHSGGHLLVLAGPGTGKTTTLAELIADRIAGGTRAERILALTFGRRAADDLAERVARRLGGGPQPVVATFHAYAYGLVRQHADTQAFQSPPRLLTAAEQDVRVAELLTHAVREGRIRWPDELAGAVGTRGIAEHVRLLMARARAQGLDGRGLAACGRAAGIRSWVAVGQFLEEYLDTLGFEGSMDYDDLIGRATELVAGRDARAQRIRAGLDLVVVDEYQDTDPAQVRMLAHLSRGGARVVAVGDPDQAIYGFRGADVGGLLRFTEQFAGPDGTPAEIVVLRTARRFARPIAVAAQGVLGPVPLGALPAQVQREHRTPRTAEGLGIVGVRTYPSAAAEAAGIADHLIRARAGALGGGPVPWSQMAVLVRSPAVSAPALVRALRQAQVPVAVPRDELALADEPAVEVIASAVRLALAGPVAPAVGSELLAGPLGRLDPVAVRSLARAALHEQRLGEADSGEGESGSDPLSSGSQQALTSLLRAGRGPVGRDTPAGYRRVLAAVEAARQGLRRNDLVSEVLWAVWTATDWPARLQAAALSAGGAAGSAHRDLDAVVALFELANRLPAQLRGPAGVRAFLDQVAAQRLAVDAGRGAATTRDEVRVFSAHRAKGLEWEVVVVAGVQEGVWPDVRLRSDLLRTQWLGPQGRAVAPTVTDLLSEERRLLYVACTRARTALLVTAVAEPVDGGQQPSRLISDLGVPAEHDSARRRAPVRSGPLVTELRQAACAPPTVRADGSLDPDVEALRSAAVARLSVLAGRARTQGVDLGSPLRGADPETWWGARPSTTDEPRLPDGQLELPWSVAVSEAPERRRSLSPSSVEQLLTCPLRWFLERRLQAGPVGGPAAPIGTLVHALVRAVAAGELPADQQALEDVLDQMWAAMPFPARYQRDNERRRVSRMLASFLAWHAGTGREVLGLETRFRLDVAGDGVAAVVEGSVDRLDLAPDGSVRIVDYKTSRSALPVAAGAEHPQLGIYQLAVLAGAVPGVPSRPGGGELVFLADTDRHGLPKERTQPGLSEAGWVEDLVVQAAELAGGPGYPARPNKRCGSCAFRAMCPAVGQRDARRPHAGRTRRDQPEPAGQDVPVHAGRASRDQSEPADLDTPVHAGRASRDQSEPADLDTPDHAGRASRDQSKDTGRDVPVHAGRASRDQSKHTGRDQPPAPPAVQP